MPWQNASNTGVAALQNRGGGHSWLGGLLTNFGHGVENFGTGLVSTAELAGKNIGAGGALIYGSTGLPGSRGAMGFAKSVGRQDVKTGENLVNHYVKTYGPAFWSAVHGHPLASLEHLGHAAYQDPFGVALDAATAWGGAGALARGLSRAADLATGETATGGFRNAWIKSVQETPNIPGRPNLLSPRYRTPRLVEHYPNGPGGAVERVSLPRPAMSTNPLSRPFQRLGSNVGGRVVNRAADSTLPGTGYLTQARRADFAAGRIGLQGAAQSAGRVGAADAAATGDYARAVGKLNGPERIATSLHLEGFLSHPGLTGLEAAQNVLRSWSKGLVEKPRMPGMPASRMDVRVANVNALRDIMQNHPHLLDLETAGGRVQQAVNAGRELGDYQEQLTHEVSGMPREALQLRRGLVSRVIHGQQEINPELTGVAKYSESPVTGFQPNENAVYMRHYNPVRTKQARAARANSVSFDPFGIKASEGKLAASGELDLNPNRLIAEVHDLHVKQANQTAIGRILDEGALRSGVNPGAFARGSEAIHAAMAEPDRYMLVDQPKAVQALQQGGVDLPKNAVFGTPTEITQAAKDFAGSNANDLMAVNRRMVETWRRGAFGTEKTDAGRIYDKGLSWWKQWTLTSRPAWYVHTTLGHGLQAGLLAGHRTPVALLRGSASRYPETAKAIAELHPTLNASFAREANAAGLAPELVKAGVGERMGRAPSAAFHLNDVGQQVIRRGGYLGAAAKAVRNEPGIANLALRPVRLGGMTDAELAARLRALPKGVVAHQNLESSRFLGDYAKFNRLETQLKRVIPFYAWNRVSNRLMGNLIARHPALANAIYQSGRAATPVENPQELLAGFPDYAKGGIGLLGGVLGLRSTNPLGVPIDEASGVAQGKGLGSILAGLAASSASPLVQIPIQEWTRQNMFTGGPFSAPPGHNGTAQSYGGPLLQRNAQGNWVQADNPTPGLFSDIMSLNPWDQVMRSGLSLLAGGNKPYDTTNDLDLLRAALHLGSGNKVDLFKPAAMHPSGVHAPLFLSSLASALGAPFYRVNPQQLAQSTARNNAEGWKAYRSTLKYRQKLAARLGQ